MSYTLTKAKYAQKSIAIRSEGVGMWKSREGGIAQAMGGRWSGREGAYILPATKEAKFREYADDPRVHSDSFNERVMCNIPEETLAKWQETYGVEAWLNELKKA